MDQSFHKTVSRSKMTGNKFRLADSKILDSLQNTFQKKNSTSVSILPKLKESILLQNSKALEALANQVKTLKKEYNNLMDKK